MKNIKMNVNKAFLILATLTLVAFLPACSPEETEPEKTVDRSKLTDKDWYDENGVRAHYFHSDGTYKNSGTWSWYESGDSMQIIHQVLGTYNFHFDYITDTEMRGGTVLPEFGGTFQVYTTSP
jgi:hypothetical protein